MYQHTSEDAEDQGLTAFAMIPKWVLRSGGKLSSNAVHLYAVIMTYADNVTKTAFPSRETLAEDMGVSVATIKRAVKELEKYGAVKVRRERNKKNGNFFANEYTLAYDSPWVAGDPRGEVSATPRVKDDPPPQVIVDPPPWVKDDPITRLTLTKPKESKNPRLEEVPLSSAKSQFLGDEVNHCELPASRQKTLAEQREPMPEDIRSIIHKTFLDKPA